MDRYNAVRHKPANPVVVEDLLQLRSSEAIDEAGFGAVAGLNEWRNIQDIVRLTFKAFHDVLKAQGDAIKTLERVVDTKANRNEVASALAAKANSVELAGRLHDLETQLFRKADASVCIFSMAKGSPWPSEAASKVTLCLQDMNKRALKCEVEQALGSRVGDIMTILESKPAFADMHSYKEESDSCMSSIRRELSHLSRLVGDTRADLEERATLKEVSQALEHKADQAEVDAALNTKVDRTVFLESQAKKADGAYVDQMEADLKAALHDLTSRVADKADHCVLDRIRESSYIDANSVQANFKSLNSSLARLESQVGDEAAARRDALSKKVDLQDMHRALDKKADLEYVAEALQGKADSNTVALLQERNESNCEIAGRVVLLKEEMAKKANVKDVCTLLHTKANTEDVNKVLVDMCSELDKKCNSDDLKKSVKDQAIINSSLCADMSFGRWLWKSGKTKAGHGVPWNVQTLNTDPDNFYWERDKATIMTIAPGLYEITFGFFTKKKPAIQVLVNGDPVLSAINNNSYVTHHSSGRLTTISSHPAGNVTGLTCIDFLALPCKARIAITCQSEEGGEGFLSLKKL